MALLVTTTKIIFHNHVTDDADSVSGSYAKAIKDYLDTIDDAKVVSIHSLELSSSGSIMTVIITKA
jgi:hypothetical protein|tara:strand:- start:87 stop:284 length:198 start_codon:yes stop_codon:yes gene_type:complete